MTKTVLRLTLSGIFAVLTALGVAAAVFFKPAFFAFYPEFSRKTVGFLADMTSVLPVALCEILVVLLTVLFIFTLIRAIARRRPVRFLTGLLLVAVIVIFAFVGIWGLNYFAPPMAERLGMTEKQFTPTELREATEYYRDRANELAPRMQRDEEGRLIPWEFEDLAADAGKGYEVLGQQYDCFDGSLAAPKKLLFSPLIGKFGFTGGFICLTGESCICTTVYPLSMPFTMCHEMGHRMAFAREDEANFAGFLACSVNPRPEFQYSGYYNAFKYCFNSLYAEDQAAAEKVWAGVCPEMAADWNGAAVHYEAVENETAVKVADKVYDGYLKAFSVEEGAKSYGEVTDLLTLWYQQHR